MGSKRFPTLLIWALTLPIVGFLIAHLFGKDVGGAIFILSCLAEVLIVPVALFLLIRGTHVTVLNILLTLAAAVPAGVAVFFAWTLKYGHFHI